MKADFRIFPRGARSEALELRPKLIQKANATPITPCFIENRHEDLLVIFFRYFPEGLYAIDSAGEILQFLDHRVLLFHRAGVNANSLLRSPSSTKSQPLVSVVASVLAERGRSCYVPRIFSTCPIFF